MQWGYKGSKGNVTFPIKFEEECYTPIAIKADTSLGGSSEAWVAVTGKTITYFSWSGQWSSHIYWIAMGY